VLQWPTPLSLTLLAALALVAVTGARRMPLVSVGLGWFLVCLLPAHSLVPRYDILSERNLYLPSAGMFIAATASFVSLVDLAGRARRWPAVAGVAAYAVAVAWLGAATIDRNRAYRDEVTFWLDAARKSPRKSRPHANLGYALMKAGDVDGALREYRVALALDPDNLPARQNLRDAWLEKQRGR
jgi:tetratricopeptide (TPR) repeat protein